MTFTSPTRLRKMSMPYKFTDGKLYDEYRIETFKDAVEAGTLKPHVLDKWNTILALPPNYTVQGAVNPWNIPENYSDNSDINQEMLLKFHNDTKACAGYALRYLILGNESDANIAAYIIGEYAKINTFFTNAGSTLNWFDGWTLLIQSALMIKGTTAYTATLDFNFKTTISLALATLDRIAYTTSNNWAAWGLAMEMASSVLLQDRAQFMRAIDRWRELFNYTIVSNFLVANGGPANGTLKNNVAWQEIYRAGSSQGNGAYGLLYSAFHLDGMVMAAEFARLNGEWLFDHITPDGSSLQGFWTEIAYMKRYGAPSLSADYLEVQWFNTSNLASPGDDYYYSGYYTNRVGGSFYILQELWPLQTAEEIMHGGFMTVAVAPGAYPPIPEGQPSVMHNGVPILQDYYGFYGADILYYGRPLWG